MKCNASPLYVQSRPTCCFYVVPSRGGGPKAGASWFESAGRVEYFRAAGEQTSSWDRNIAFFFVRRNDTISPKEWIADGQRLNRREMHFLLKTGPQAVSGVAG
jgi:hypothetical protein